MLHQRPSKRNARQRGEAHNSIRSRIVPSVLFGPAQLSDAYRDQTDTCAGAKAEEDGEDDRERDPC